MMTPRQVGEMSDEELADILNKRWTAIVLLLHKFGGEAVFTEKELAEWSAVEGLYTSHDLVNGTMTLRIIEKALA